MIKNAFVLLFFIILTAVFSFPIILNMNERCLAFSSSDEILSPVWQYWYIGYSWKNKLGLLATDFIAYPFGVRIFEVVSPVYLTLAVSLSRIFSRVAVLNIQILSNFVLTGFFTYLLILKITKSRLAGILSGAIFTFSPQHFVRSWQHITLSYFQWLPLYILALFKLKEEPNLRHSLFAAFALSVAASFDLHFLFFLGIASVLFAIAAVFCENKNRISKIIKYLTLCAIVSLFLTFVQFPGYFMKIFSQHNRVSSAHNILKRPFEDLFSQSARPLSYILPSTEHPLLGDFTRMFIGSSLYGDSLTEHNLYLGMVALFLAAFGLVSFRKVKPGKDANFVFTIRFFSILAIIAWLFSQPPWINIFCFKFPAPSLLIYKFLPMLRAYCRFGIMVMLSVAVLAGIGVQAFICRLNSPIKKILAFLLLLFLVLFDFWNDPARHTMDLSRYNDAYGWLKSEDAGIIMAEYPLDTNGPSDFYKFFQTIHEKKIINGSIPGTAAHSFAQNISRLSHIDTTKVLQCLGVRYVLVHRGLYAETGLQEDVEELNKIATNPELIFLRRFYSPEYPAGSKFLYINDGGPIDVYRLKENE